MRGSTTVEDIQKERHNSIRKIDGPVGHEGMTRPIDGFSRAARNGPSS